MLAANVPIYGTGDACRRFYKGFRAEAIAAAALSKLENSQKTAAHQASEKLAVQPQDALKQRLVRVASPVRRRVPLGGA